MTPTISPNDITLKETRNTIDAVVNGMKLAAAIQNYTPAQREEIDRRIHEFELMAKGINRLVHGK